MIQPKATVELVRDVWDDGAETWIPAGTRGTVRSIQTQSRFPFYVVFDAPLDGVEWGYDFSEDELREARK